MCSEGAARILIIDDQANWRKAFKSLLEHSDYIVFAVENFDQAIEQIESKRFDLIILDIRLDDSDNLNISGLSLLPIIDRRQPDTRVIIVTGYLKAIPAMWMKELKTYSIDAVIEKVPYGSQFDRHGFEIQVREILRNRSD